MLISEEECEILVHSFVHELLFEEIEHFPEITNSAFQRLTCFLERNFNMQEFLLEDKARHNQ
jgi:hypothetical protein